LLRKLHSLSGALPVGGFLVFHLWTNAKALNGQEQFDAAVRDIGHIPYLRLVELGAILLPLAFHAIYGVKLAFDAKYNVGRYSFTRNWAFTLQRITGLLALVFIGYHLWEYWGQKVAGKMAPEQFYPSLCAHMSSTWHGVPLVAIAYILGIAASVYHFANGLWGFCFSWGITVSRRSQRMAATVFGLVGLAVFLLGANTAIYFATGSRFPGLLFGEDKAGAHTCVDVATASKTAQSTN
jgi:succinate dehydrogenase/fumarate reductase cytochrome b subunit (b558 family)